MQSTFHPLAKFERDILSHDNKLSLPDYTHEVNSMVSLKDTIYLRDEGQVLSYSMTERSWDANISTPEEAARGYQLAVCSNNLVLVGGYIWLKNCLQRKTFKVWVYQGTEWNADIIPPVPVDDHNEILSAAGSDNILFVLCKQPYGNDSSKQNTFILYHIDISTKQQWQKPLKGPSFANNCRPSASLIAVSNSNILYAVIYSQSPYCNLFFRGSITVASDNTTLCDIEWRQLHLVGNDITSCVYPTIFGDSLIIAEVASEVKLYTLFKDTLVDIDELNLAFEYPICGISGLSSRSLVVIGKVKSSSNVTLKSAVVLFKLKGIATSLLCNTLPSQKSAHGLH